MSRAATARLFVAVDPPAAAREELARWAREATAGVLPREALRLLDPELLHITVCFLGSRPVAEIEPLGDALAGCAGHSGELAVGGPLWLPPRHPNALALEIHDADGELASLHEELAGALAAVSGWEPERRRFRAHVTVARLRGGRRRRTRDGRDGRGGPGAALELAPTPELRFVPETLALYRSWLSPAGASYEQLAACTLLPAGG